MLVTKQTSGPIDHGLLSSKGTKTQWRWSLQFFVL